MALRVSNSAQGVAGSDTVTVTDNGSQAGDQLTLVVIVNNESAATITWPSGFTQFASADNSGANRGFRTFIAAAWATTSAASYAITVQGGNGTTPSLIFAANSSRTTGAPTNFAASNDVLGSTSPVSIALTGITALSGDDLLWLGSANNTGAWVFTAPTGMTSQQTQDLTSGSGYGFNLSTEDNVASGATGTLTGIATLVSANADAVGLVVSLPAAAAPPTSKPSPILLLGV